MKKIRGDKAIGVMIHIYMAIPQGNALCSYLYLKLAKMSCFSFYLFSLFFYKIGKWEGGTGPAQWGRLASVGGGR
jgi:hypothetical protein